MPTVVTELCDALSLPKGRSAGCTNGVSLRTLRSALLYERLRQRVSPPETLCERSRSWGTRGPHEVGIGGEPPRPRCLTAEASTDFALCSNFSLQRTGSSALKTNTYGEN